MRFVIFDLNNLVKRAQHGKSARGADEEIFGSLVLHIALDSFQYLYHMFGDAHVVAAVDSGSWRFQVYPEYKSNREYNDNDDTVRNLIRDFADYLEQETAVTLLRSKGAEADDFIARWVQLHSGPEYENIIVSGDGDFKQLVNDNTSLYSPNSHHLYTIEGVFSNEPKKKDGLTAIRYGREWKVICDADGEAITFDPEYELFLKCIRGDSSDFIPSAYPRIRETKIKAAYADRGGALWNNLINAQIGEDGQTSVRTQYEFNRSLIDLRLIPDNVKEQLDEAIGMALLRETPTMIPYRFKKFCAKHQLPKMAERQSAFTLPLGKTYPLEITNEVSSDSEKRAHVGDRDEARSFFQDSSD